MNKLFFLFLIPFLAAASVGPPTGFENLVGGNSVQVLFPAHFDKDGYVQLQIEHDLLPDTTIVFENCLGENLTWRCDRSAGDSMIVSNWSISFWETPGSHQFNASYQIYANDGSPQAVGPSRGFSGTGGGEIFHPWLAPVQPEPAAPEPIVEPQPIPTQEPTPTEPPIIIKNETITPPIMNETELVPLNTTNETMPLTPESSLEAKQDDWVATALSWFTALLLLFIVIAILYGIGKFTHLID